MNTEKELAAALVEVVRESLRDGISVELDGLGTFLPRGRDGMEFVPENRPRAFLSYVNDDCKSTARLAEALNAAGIKTWMDKQSLLPGQEWQGAIERAIDRSDFFVACFSCRATRKRGQFPYELRYALRCAERMPLGEVFIMPVRFDSCRLPDSIETTSQHVDLFPESLWKTGVARLVDSIQREYALRKRRDAAPGA